MPRPSVQVDIRHAGAGDGIRRVTAFAMSNGAEVGRAVAEIGSREDQVRWRRGRSATADSHAWSSFGPADPVAYVRDVDVQPEWRRRGIGRRLMRALLREVNRLGAGAWLAAAPTDEDGPVAADLAGFYASLSFEEVASGGFIADMVRSARTRRRAPRSVGSSEARLIAAIGALGEE